MARQRDSRNISKEPTSVTRQRRGPSMRVPGQGKITRPLNEDYQNRSAHLHGDVMHGGKQVEHEYEKVVGREHLR